VSEVLPTIGLQSSSSQPRGFGGAKNEFPGFVLRVFLASRHSDHAEEGH